ncbi:MULTISPECIES: histidine phosphatase family protein [Sulfurospirillum]|uniref:phosphoglycerate mutase (2,3-diphosphoglycerate-dependent) n=4 Tax=Sulfurospirillum TaxID=57665 RepID=A0A1Y0HLF1_9BACT|nr:MULTISPECIES: histidine phosphatase family protein [Sulfurospirillum]AHJ12810.1 alpha-ribazole phosphatase CobC [Sulfurospirillum multivorans DSM 12446]AOO65289.1 alpha-ribazole phosphatase CobC [Sulfurospirillum halorespirans DSM 13726]ARU48770.1 alpha-ribazole phosphatase CobC [Sulfurospirillum diekertiae]ASC93592.1 alpha-ribazole phosphatase CobC [Sulfurospirillum diekertiae]ATB69636.1 alpha-ribazole phosphatase CobC [Sulfurospirillum diekertiae]
MKTEIYLLRHGETGLNRQKVYFGHLDAAMNELGKECIAHVANNFFGPLDVIISSDLERCAESARIFSRSKKIKVTYDQRLRELDFGVFEGRTYASLMEEFPKEAEQFFSGDYDFVIPKGESVKMLFERTYEAFEEIIANHAGKHILISTHGGAIRAILSRYLAGNKKAYWKFAVEHASLTKLVHEDGFVYLEYLGRGEKIQQLAVSTKMKKGA